MMRFLFWSMLAAVVILATPASNGAAALPHAARADSVVLTDSVRAVARLLVVNGAPDEKAVPVAAAIMKYSRIHELDPLLVVGIIGVENSTLEDRARSDKGATGVMQVMPRWKRDIRDCGQDLHDVNVNVCFGTRILRIALDSSKSLHEALLRYNGCRRGQECRKYPGAVFSRAGRAVLLARAES
jgi:soluble lytic murein transglycosylase-like protein